MVEFSRVIIIKSMQDAAERMGLDLDDLQEMIVEVLDDCQTKSKALQEAVSAGDAVKIKAIAHDIKGSTANYGLPDTSNLALKIEKSCEDMPKDLIEELGEHFAALSKLNLEKTA